MFISRKLAMGKGGSGRRGPPGHPTPTGRGHAKESFLLLLSVSKARKEGLISS